VIKYKFGIKWGMYDVGRIGGSKERKTPPLMAEQKTTLSAMQFYLKK
jgi:hypothetical protein